MNNEQIDNTSYYTLPSGRQLEDFIADHGLKFAEGSALKYLWRAGKKDGESAEKDRDELRARVRELERYKTSLDMPDADFRPEVACQDRMIDLRFEGIMPYIRFTVKAQSEFTRFSLGCPQYVRFRLEVDTRNPPLELNQIFILNNAFRSLTDFIYKKTNNIQKGNN